MADHDTPAFSEESGAHRADSAAGELGPARTRAIKSIEAPPPVHRIVEALLFVGGPPLTPARASETIRGFKPEQLSEAVDLLNDEYRRQNRLYVVRAQDHGFVLALRPRVQPLVDKLHGAAREARLSSAAIDVLALVAYRQPIPKHELDTLRGTDSGAILRHLVRRRLIAIVQRRAPGQREALYGTTERFLELFGLKSLDDLPQTQDLQQQ
jgi:segregation and condensation protein B